jgi:predicted nuclease of restriction endonuclease-like (RecB) superfamily
MKSVASKKSSAYLIREIRFLIESARHRASSTVNTLQVLTNFEIGRRIVEHEQKGKARAEYGKTLLKTLSHALTNEFGSGFSERNLLLFRKFYIEYAPRTQSITQTVSAKFKATEIPQKPSAESVVSKSPFVLSWSHYVLLLGIKKREERAFYEIEAVNESWSLSELKRQVSSSLYERLALSRNKKKIQELAKAGQILSRPEDALKEPYVLEFLGLGEKASYSESELEQAIIDRIEHFLLELGKGFLFEARQKRFTFDEDHFFVDLVFYNRLLRCYVLVDLKLDKLTHQDLGQMQMYVNHFDRYVKLPTENPTIGIVLCKRNKQSLVELTLPKDANIHAREYQLYLPSKELLTERLEAWTREAGAGR